MIRTLRELKKFNPNLKTNYIKLTLHGLVLIFNLAPLIAICLPEAWFTPTQIKIMVISSIVTDTMS